MARASARAARSMRGRFAERRHGATSSRARAARLDERRRLRLAERARATAERDQARAVLSLLLDLDRAQELRALALRLRGGHWTTVDGGCVDGILRRRPGGRRMPRIRKEFEGQDRTGSGGNADRHRALPSAVCASMFAFPQIPGAKGARGEDRELHRGLIRGAKVSVPSTHVAPLRDKIGESHRGHVSTIARDGRAGRRRPVRRFFIIR